MKKSWNIIALATALSFSAAYASGTAAGTEIENTASLFFTPEGADPSKPPKKVDSNPVITVVLPQPSFTITPNDGSGDVTKPDYSKPGQTGSAKPCDKNVSFLYTLTNTGNLNGESYTIGNTPDPTGAVKAPENIRYVIDANGDNQLNATELQAAKPTLTISGVDQDKAVKFFVIYDIPCNATGDEPYGSDPTGDRKDNPTTTKDDNIKVPKDANNSNKVTVTRKDGVVIGPKDDSNADNKVDGGNNANTVYDSPQGNKIYPGGVALDGAPVAKDEQVAVVDKRQGDTTVTFSNTVTNTGNRPDVFKITTDKAGLPAGSTVSIFKDAAGTTPLTDTDKLDPNASQTVYVRVTIPASVPTSELAKDPVVKVVATSTNDNKKSDPTKDIIRFKLPGVAFGDPDPAVGGNPTPVGTPPAGTPGSPSNPVDTSKCSNTSAKVRTFLPMEIGNIGSIVDSYNLKGVAPIKLLNPDGTVNPTPVNVDVIYYKDANGNGKLDAGEDASPITNTGPIQPGKEVKLLAVVDVPCGAIAQDIILNQEAKSPTTGSTGKDTNDKIVVAPNPDVEKPVKSVDKKEAKPGEVLTYTITAKNTSNAGIKGAFICDAVPEHTDFVSFSATSTASSKVMYAALAKGSDASTAKNWAAAAISTLEAGGAAANAKGGIACAAPDINGDGKIDTSDVLAPGKTITVTFKVKVR